MGELQYKTKKGLPEFGVMASKRVHVPFKF